MARTDAQVLGGFELRNIEHSDANWFQRVARNPPFRADELREYLDTYAVRWVVVRKGDTHPWWDAQTELWSRAAFADEVIIYRVKSTPQLLDGRGEVEVGVNRIAITGSDPSQDLLVRYHWMETLACTPDCRIERAQLERDRVGFMRIPAPHPADFEIVNTYVRP